MEDKNRVVGFDPFFDFTRREGDKIRDWGVKKVEIRD
jgi:hypothetical protein